VLQRLLELRVEVEIFLTDKKHPLASKCSESGWILKVAYLADIFGEINELNTAMQGGNRTILDLELILKTQLWST
jgi:hypothetical protein